MYSHSASEMVLRHNSEFIPGGMVSINRAADPPIVFDHGRGAYLWDVSGQKYLDYHAAFGAIILGHANPYVDSAVRNVIEEGSSLFGSGTTELEGRLAELICDSVPSLESIQLLNSGSEATYQALRLARASTARSHIIKPQGGYHGWHNDVACNLMTPLELLGPRVSPGEYPFRAISAGVPDEHQKLVHITNFNDLESIEWLCKKYPVAAIITEPILQNIGLIRPRTGYLEGLRSIADQYGCVLIFDEIKTGFRHALGGYTSLCGVTPDIAVYGKAVANGYPIAVIGGKKKYMDLFVAPDLSRRVLLAGTYNGHPIPVAAAIATIERLRADQGSVFRSLEALGERIQNGLETLYSESGIQAVISRQGSAFCVYFMDHLPVDWHDLVRHNDFDIDARIRKALVNAGIYLFPLSPKQCSISAAHSEADIDLTLEVYSSVLKSL